MAETLVISGTHRPGSYTRRVSGYILEQLNAQGHQADLFDLQDLPADFLKAEMFGQRTEGFREVENQLKEAKSYIWVLPEYNGGFPGVAKLLIDSMNPREVFRGKQAALVGVSSGKFGNQRGLDMFTLVLNYIQVEVLPFKPHLMKIGQAPNWPEGYDMDELEAFLSQYSAYVGRLSARTV